MRGTGCGVRVTWCGVRDSGYVVRVAGFGLRGAGCVVRVTWCGLFDCGMRILDRCAGFYRFYSIALLLIETFKLVGCDVWRETRNA